MTERRFVLSFLPSGGVIYIVGPFPTTDEAQAWAVQLQAEGGDGRECFLMAQNPFLLAPHVSVVRLTKRANPRLLFRRGREG